MNEMTKVNIKEPLVRILDTKAAWIKQLTPEQKQFALEVFKEYLNKTP